MEERVGSISKRQQRNLQIETEQQESTQRAQRLELEDIENQEVFQRSTTKSISHLSDLTLEGAQQHNIENQDLALEGAQRHDIENRASISTRRQTNLQRKIWETDLLGRSNTKSASVSTRKQNALQLEIEEQASVLTRKQKSLLTEMEERKSMHGGALRLELESEASVLTRKQKSLLREMEERKSMHGGALRLELESEGCKDMKIKALPDQVEVETFQTKGCQYDYGENITHSKKSMSFRNFVTPHKGLVLVIVNYSFPNKPLERGNDIEEIEQLFPGYGYEVYSFTDLSKEGILSKVKLFSEKENIDRFICFISSHGNQTSLACPDGGIVRINDILSAANTKQLENKPKVFFIDACRANLNQDIKESYWPEPPSTEYYVGFSCLASKISLVGKNSCGIYFQALIEVFKDGFWRSPREESKIRDINHFMEKVHHRVNRQKDKQGNNYQMPIFRSTLTGKLFLQGDIDVSNTLHNTDQESKMLPVESRDSKNITRTTSSTHFQHHVHFSDQLPTQESSNHSQPSSKSTVKLSGTSILTKTGHQPVQSSYPEDNVTISSNLNDVDCPGKDDDDNQFFEETEYDDCSVGPKSDNIILGKPIPYIGDPNIFRHWFPVVHIDGRLGEFPGCHPDVDEKKIKHIVSEQKDNEGDYVIWYSGKRRLLIITVIHRFSPKGRYHYNVKCRQSDSEVSYRFSSQHESKSVVELLDYARAEGLPPPVQKKTDGWLNYSFKNNYIPYKVTSERPFK